MSLNPYDTTYLTTLTGKEVRAINSLCETFDRGAWALMQINPSQIDDADPEGDFVETASIDPDAEYDARLFYMVTQDSGHVMQMTSSTILNLHVFGYQEAYIELAGIKQALVENEAKMALVNVLVGVKDGPYSTAETDPPPY